MKISLYLSFLKFSIFRNGKFFESFESIFSIDFNELRENGFQLLVFDYDDTLTGFKGELSSRSRELLSYLIKLGFKVAIFSNCSVSHKRFIDAQIFDLGIYNCQTSDKPFERGFEMICEHFGVNPINAVMIGDRVGTDIYGGYRAGFGKLILVRAFSLVFGGRNAGFGIRIIRFLEILISSRL